MVLFYFTWNAMNNIDFILTEFKSSINVWECRSAIVVFGTLTLHFVCCWLDHVKRNITSAPSTTLTTGGNIAPNPDEHNRCSISHEITVMFLFPTFLNGT